MVDEYHHSWSPMLIQVVDAGDCDHQIMVNEWFMHGELMVNCCGIVDDGR